MALIPRLAAVAASSALLLSAAPGSAAAAGGPLYRFPLAGNGGSASRPVSGVAKLVPLGEPTAVAVLPSGAVVVALRDPADEREQAWLERISPQGRITHVAGSARTCSKRSGAPGLSACLSAPVSVLAAEADGGLLLDPGGLRVGELDRAGLLHIVAGTGYPGFSGDGGPATDADLGGLQDLLALPGGGFLIADGNRVRRVDTDGTISTVAGTGLRASSAVFEEPAAPRAVPAADADLDTPGLEALRHREILIATTGSEGTLSRLSPTGMLEPLFPRRFSITDAGGLAVDDAGTVFQSDCCGGIQRLGLRGGSGVRIVDAASGRRIGRHGLEVHALAGARRGVVAAVSGNYGYQGRVVALAPIPSAPLRAVLRTRAARADQRHTVIPVLLTRRAAVTVRIRHGARPIVAARATIGAGAGSLVVHRRLRPAAYTLSLDSRAGGVTVRDATVRILGGTLPVAIAAAITGDLAGELDDPARAGACRRLAATRVDCTIVRGSAPRARARCRRRVAYVLRTTGELGLKGLDCSGAGTHALRGRPPVRLRSLVDLPLDEFPEVPQ